MADIYEQHSAAFARVSAFVILRGGKRVATIAFKFPADGAGRLYAYVHWFGVPMVRGFANGYGYDKRTAACASAVNRIDWAQHDTPDMNEMHHAREFTRALAADRGPTWDSALRDAGYTVLQAV